MLGIYLCSNEIPTFIGTTLAVVVFSFFIGWAPFHTQGSLQSRGWKVSILWGGMLIFPNIIKRFSLSFWRDASNLSKNAIEYFFFIFNTFFPPFTLKESPRDWCTSSNTTGHTYTFLISNYVLTRKLSILRIIKIWDFLEWTGSQTRFTTPSMRSCSMWPVCSSISMRPSTQS